MKIGEDGKKKHRLVTFGRASRFPTSPTFLVSFFIDTETNIMYIRVKISLIQ